MRTPGAPLIIATLAAAAAVACTESVTTPTPAPDSPGTRGFVSLVAPSSGALITQNDASLECPAHLNRGHGFRLTFDWEDVVGAERYLVRLMHTGAQYAAIDHSIVESSLDQAWCNAFVTDANLTNWVWRVAALAPGSGGAAADTLWSEERIYGFHPCRHPDGSPCSAPVEPEP